MKGWGEVKSVFHSHFALNVILILLSRPILLLLSNQCVYTLLTARKEYVFRPLYHKVTVSLDVVLSAWIQKDNEGNIKSVLKTAHSREKGILPILCMEHNLPF